MNSTAPSTGLHVRDLSRRFGPRWVLARVHLRVDAGESLLLLGPNGSGKTTLLRCLAAALKPHHGEATFNGVPIWEGRRIHRRHAELLSHASRLYADLGAAQNLSVWAQMGGYEADVHALLQRVGLHEVGPRPVRTFSAGMKRRLALARALLKRPQLVLFDEPFSALDPQGRDLVGDILSELREGGSTLVLSTHHPALGARYAEQAVVLESGQVRWRGASHLAGSQLEVL